MTVAESITLKVVYTGPDAGPLAVPLPIQNAGQLKATRRETDDTLTVLTQGAGTNGYTVASDLNTITITEALISGQKITLQFDVPKSQLADLRDNQAFSAETLEESFDKLTLIVNQMGEESARAVKLPIENSGANSTLTTLTAGAILLVNSTADGFEMGPTTTDVANAEANAATATAAAATATTEADRAAAAAASLPQNNLSATTAPTVDNDSTEGYSIGSKWYDIANDEAYVLLDSTAGAAVWITSTLSVDDLGALAVLDTVTTTQINASTLVTEAEGINSNDNDTTIPTSAAVKDYVDNNSGVVVQKKHYAFNTLVSGTGTIPYDNTIPQNTEGSEFMTGAITPTSATNRLKVEVTFFYTNTAFVNQQLALFQDSSANALAAVSYSPAGGGYSVTLPLAYDVVAGSTSEIVFKVRSGGDGAGTTYMNGSSAGAQLFGGVAVSSISITEYIP